MVTPTNDHELRWHIEPRLGPPPIKQAASCKSALPYIIFHTWLIPIRCPTKAKIWLTLETTLY